MGMTRNEPCEICGEDNWICHDYRDADGNGEVSYYCHGQNHMGICSNIELLYFDKEGDLADESYDARCDRDVED